MYVENLMYLFVTVWIVCCNGAKLMFISYRVVSSQAL